ncbi:MAG: hypothetical protein MUC97_00060 [Bernardetiaceae bacterium]|jgi:hypothetical protein|nr:hypothetical protein [Bernardetiaceae bacterium]
MPWPRVSLLPYEEFTLVSAHPAPVVLAKLAAATQPSPTSKTGLPRFNGAVTPQEFRLALAVTQPTLYLPLLKGRVEATSAGCIIFAKFSLFRSSQVLFGFGAGLGLFFTGLQIWVRVNYWHAGFVALLSLLFYAVGLVNFNMQKKNSFQLFTKTIA